MELVLEHLKANYGLYIVGTMVLLPTIYVTRRWTVPIILFLVELSIYFALMHGVMNLLVAITRWFKENSSMRALREDGKPLDTPEWGTPLLNFWDKTAYDPQWLVYLELSLAAIILFLVWRYRPIKFQRRKTQRQFNNEGGKKNSVYRKNYAEPLDPPNLKGPKRGK